MRNKWLGAILFGFIIIMLGVSQAMAYDADTYNNKFYPNSAYKKGIVPSFSLESASQESISPVTGDLEIKTTDVFLKGKNGLDLALTRYYSLSQSNIYENQVSAVSNGMGGYILYDDLYLNTFNDKYYDIGAGWAFDLPYVEVRNGWPYLHYGSSGAWTMNNFNASEVAYYPEDENIMKDLSLKIDLSHSFTNGQTIDGTLQTSFFIVQEKDGKKLYFSDNGFLLGIVDRFGNQITFFYTVKYDAYNTKHYFLSKITDSLQRDVNIQYDDPNNRIVISYTDNAITKSITYNRARIIDKTSTTIDGFMPNTEFVLNNVVDAEGRVTSYDYAYNLVKASLVHKTASLGVGNMYTALQKITYPTGAYSMYIATNKLTRNCGVDGVMEFYKISNRQDYNTTSGGMFNPLLYLYNRDGTGEPDGYPSYYGTNIPAGYTVKTEVNSVTNTTSSLKETYTFNKDSRNIQTVAEGTDHKQITTSEYDSKKTLTKTIKQTYNKLSGNYMEQVENYVFNEYRDMTGYWGVQANRDSNKVPINDELKVTFVYHPTYHYVTSKSYKKNASKSIVELNVPSSDGKTVTRSMITDNGTTKKQTDFLYDSYGNVIEKRDFLDGLSSYIPIKFSYANVISARNGAYLTRMWQEGIVDADGASVTPKSGGVVGTVDEVYNYDGFGNMIEKMDSKGTATSYLYDKLGRMTRENHSDGSYKTWTYTSNTSENSVLVQDENANQFKLKYDEIGRLIQEQDVTTGQVLMSNMYNDLGQLIKETNVNGSNINYAYRSDGRLKQVIAKDAANTVLHTEDYTYDEANSSGAYEKTTKTIGGDSSSPAITTHSYTNTAGLLAKLERMHNGSPYTDTFNYDYLGNKISEKSARSNDEAWSETYTSQYEVDFAGRTTKVTNIDGDFATNIYDAVGRLKSVTDIKGNQTNPTYSTVYEYDNMGRLLKETIPFEDVSGTIYYTIKKHEYDLNGNIVKEKITKNKPGEATSYDETRYEYNGLNRLVKVITYNNGNPVNYTQYYYDAVGNKIRMYTGLSSPLTITGVDLVTTNGDTDYSVTKYEYNRFGLVTKMIDPLGKFVQYIYDLNGNLIQQIDRNGNTATLAYDGLNRLLSNQVVSITDPEMNAAYAFTYARTGNRKTMTSGGAITNYVYDDLGRLITETEANGFVKAYTYDAHNSRKSLNITQGGTTVNSMTYTYNHLDQLHQVMDNGQLAATYTYDDNGNRATLTYPNGNNTEYQYNLANQLKSLINKNGTTNLSAYQYHYYLNGSHSSKADAVSLKSSTYLYDGLGRLIDETERVNSVVASTITYGYDDYNNRSVMTSTGKTTNYSYDKNNRLLTETSLMGSATQIARYGYDENGNQRIKTTEYVNLIVGGQAEGYQVSLSGENGAADTVIQEFDGFNQLIQTTIGNTTFGYTYNGDGLRTSKTVNGLTTSHIWDGQDIALDVQAGAVKSKYIRGINLLYAQDNLANKQYYLFNGHGDVVQLTSSVGAVTKTYEYDAFGNELNPVASDTNPFRYTSEYLDKETGTIYLRARYYDPSIGRFITEDSYDGQLDNPLSLNLYTYVYNNPLRYTDPSGHCGIDSWGNAGDCAIDFIPYVGTGKGYQQAFTGYNYVTGEELSTSDRWAEGVGSTVGLIPIPGAKPAGKYATKGVIYAGAKIGDGASWLWNKGKNIFAKGCNCFTAGTKVLTDEGEKPIEEIEVGDKVLAKSDETGEVAYKEVVGLFQKQADEIYYINIGDEIIEVTAEHPFWLDGKGWTEVKDLKVGDLLVSSDGSKLAIDKIEKEPREATVYNFEVADFNSYFVSNLGVWVHNCNVSLSGTKTATKWQNEMDTRGWTKDSIGNLIDNHHTTRVSTNKATGNAATVYYDKNGAYVVVDNVTKDVVQISDRINPSTWAPDSGIINPYKPWGN